MEVAIPIIRLNQEDIGDDSRIFVRTVEKGLDACPARLPSRLLYDERGSELFRQITETPEYYPTRTEREILALRASEICLMISERCNDRPLEIAELGSGDGHKSLLLLEEWRRQGRDLKYFPIDISPTSLDGLYQDFIREMKDVPFQGIEADYFQGLEWLRNRDSSRLCVMFLGSNIGNLPPAERDLFLERLRHSLNSGDMVLIGFDMIKDIDTLVRAYNDAAGITAAFNLNLLDRINEELGTDFDTNAFEHYGPYNPRIKAMESWLISLSDQEVYSTVLDRRFSFTKGEEIHLEYSYKFSPQLIEELATRHGFRLLENYCDEQNYFTDSLWQVI